MSHLYWHRGAGFDVQFLAEQRDGHEGELKLFGIRLQKLDLSERYLGLFDDNVELALFNIGGDAGGEDVIGACFVYYVAERAGDEWRVRFTAAKDP